VEVAMSIQITKDTTEDPWVDTELIIRTIEKSRDRLRTTAGMIMTLSGMSVSAALAITIFLLKQQSASFTTLVLVGLAAVSLFAGSLLAVESSFFRQEYAITTQSQFVADLLKLLGREMRFLRLASASTLLGLALIAAAVLVEVGSSP
jgi:hypothetical protein